MKLAPIFNHHTVLQANRPIRIYGIGSGSATIRLNGEEKSIRSEGGFWCVTFSPRSYGGPYELSVTLNGETVEITRRHHVIDFLLDARVGDTVTFNILRGGEKKVVEIVVDESSIVEY